MLSPAVLVAPHRRLQARLQQHAVCHLAPATTGPVQVLPCCHRRRCLRKRAPLCHGGTQLRLRPARRCPQRITQLRWLHPRSHNQRAVPRTHGGVPGIKLVTPSSFS